MVYLAHRTLAFLAAFTLWAAAAVAQDVRVVLVSDPLMEDNLLHYPVLLSNGRGYRIRCESRADEETIIAALGFLVVPGQLVDPTDPEIVEAALADNPLLCPTSENYPITLFAANTAEGLRHYLQFVEDIGSTERTNRLYTLGCAGLVDALGIDFATATQADPTPFFSGRIHEIACRAGAAPLPSDPTSFAEWCIKADLNADEEATLNAVLNTTPGGPGALGNLVACNTAQAFLQSVTTRNLNASGVRSLAPLTHLTHLTSLSLADNDITDISPLAGMTLLTFLDLQGNEIQNLSALGPLASLVTLELADNQISDLRDLSSLSSLLQLGLAGNSPTTLAPLQFLGQLQELDLSRNGLTVDALEVLAGLGQLTLLDLSDNQIDNFGVLANFNSSVSFVLSGNPATAGGPNSFLDLCILSRDEPTPNGQTIRALADASGQSTCAGAAAALSSSTSLSLAGTSVSDLTPLATLLHLTSVDLSNNTITDISTLAALTRITTLDLSDNAITDVRPLGELERMTSLTMSGNVVETGDFLSACIMRNEPDVLSPAHLIEIGALFDVSDAQTCKTAVAQLKSKSSLNLRDTGISTVDYVQVAENLTSLSISNNPITDVVPLGKLRRLKSLTASGTQLTESSGLNVLRGLEAISIANTAMREIWFLRNMQGIKTVNIRDTQVGRLQILDELPLLETVVMWNAPIRYSSMLDYCLVNRFQTGLLGSYRPTVQGVVAAAIAAGQTADDCGGIAEWSKNATRLNLNNRQIVSLEPLSSMKALKELHLFNNRISDVRPIQTLRDLVTLNLGRNRLSEIPVVFATGLQNLYLTENRIVNTQSTSRYAQLKRLDLRKNVLRNTRGLAGLSQLAHLDLRDNNLRTPADVAPLLAKQPYVKGNPVCNLQTTIPFLIQPCRREPQILLNNFVVNNNLGLILNRNLVVIPDRP